MEKKAIVIGAGLAGSLWSIYLAKAGYKVTVYERRKNIRDVEISAGKSINLALSTRGWKALEGAGIKQEVEEIAIPMPGRMMHSVDGELTFQPYGQEGQAIYSVSRGHLNAIMMNLAEEKGNANIFYEHKCVGVNLEEGKVTIQNTQTKEVFEDEADVVFGADGAFSSVRYKGFQKTNRFDYLQDFIDDGYKELLLPANEDGSYKLEKNALHIWPRGRFMLIALPNEDGSFTCTLFMPFEGENSFETLTTDEKVDQFFKDTFPDFYAIMPNLIENWHAHPLSSLCIIRCYPWTKGKTALLGDACHATVPFYGQGMNASFEDCTVLNDLMIKHNENWKEVFKEYQETRKKDGDALQDLSLHNYYVMRDYVADPTFLFQKKIEAKLSGKYPDEWMPLYSQVTFSHIPYSKAWEVGQKQDEIMKKAIEVHGLSDEKKIEDEALLSIRK